MNNTGKKVDRRITKTKKAIKFAVLSTMKDKPLNKVTIKELAEAADISRKTFYAHYSSVADVLEEIEQDAVVGMQYILSKSRDSHNRISYTFLINNFSEIISTNYDYYKLLVSLQSIENVFRSSKELLKGEMVKFYNGSTKLTQEKLSLACEFAAAGATQMISKWFKDGSNIPIEEISFLIVNFIEDSLARHLKE